MKTISQIDFGVIGKDCLLSFSCGKDSITVWLAIRDRVAIHPFYLFLVPDLEFVENSLAYYEKFFGQKIYRVPHPSLYRMLNSNVFQPPQHCAAIERAQLPNFSYDEVEFAVSEDLGFQEKLWTANGVRQADSPIRRIHFAKDGPMSPRRRVFYPIWDWLKADLVSVFQQSGVKLPFDYEMFGRSFDGLTGNYLAPIKKYFPRDYQKILEWFPMAELELFRYEQRKNIH